MVSIPTGAITVRVQCTRADCNCVFQFQQVRLQFYIERVFSRNSLIWAKIAYGPNGKGVIVADIRAAKTLGGRTQIIARRFSPTGKFWDKEYFRTFEAACEYVERHLDQLFGANPGCLFELMRLLFEKGVEGDYIRNSVNF
ncbi:MAG: hypothetical protein RMJ33_14800 [Saprospiraceae bacterium]|nr:hypothetical protein [Saprospiraceae bacterium]